MNVKLLRRVAKRILAEPKQFQMTKFFARKSTWVARDGKPPAEIPNCGTAACIAGWTIVEARGGTPRAHQHASGWDAEVELEINSDQFDALCILENWPDRFKRGWRELSFEDRAKRAAARIRRFIATNGQE